MKKPAKPAKCLLGVVQDDGTVKHKVRTSFAPYVMCRVCRTAYIEGGACLGCKAVIDD